MPSGLTRSFNECSRQQCPKCAEPKSEKAYPRAPKKSQCEGHANVDHAYKQPRGKSRRDFARAMSENEARHNPRNYEKG